MPEVRLTLLMIRCACYDFGNCNKRAKTSNGVSSDTNLLPLQIRRPPKTMVFKLVSSTFLLSDQRETKTDAYIRTYSILSKRERERATYTASRSNTVMKRKCLGRQRLTAGSGCTYREQRKQTNQRKQHSSL